MPEYLAPGVYVEETSFRAKSIEGVSTTTTGFVGPARYGPIDLEPDVITSISEFERVYGDRERLEFSPNYTMDNYLWHAARAFFEEGGKRLYAARVFRPYNDKDDHPVKYERPDFTKSGSVQAVSGHYPDGHARGAFTGSNGTISVTARFPGAAGNMRVRFTLRTGQNVLSVDGNGNARVTVQDKDVVVINQGLNSIGKIYEAISYFNRNDQRQTWKFREAGTTNEVLLSALTFNDDPRLTDLVRVVTVTVQVVPPNGGPDIVWDGLALNPSHQRAGTPDSLFGKFAPEPNSLADARTLPIVITGDSALDDGMKVLETIVASKPLPTSPPSPTAANPFSYTLNEAVIARGRVNAGVDDQPTTEERSVEKLLDFGSDGLRPGPDDYAGWEVDTTKAKTGLVAFEDVEDISIVAAPGSTYDMQSSGYRPQARAILNGLIGHATRMRYRIAVLDSGNNQTIADVRAMRGQMDSTYAALYYPWVRVLDPVTGTERNMPPSGFVCGIYARNDINRAVYKAPANEVVFSAIGFEALLNKAQQDVLNPEGINCFRFFSGRGFRLWGARTISSDPEWRYVNLRRYFAYLEHSIDRGTQWAVFEPNGEALWANVRRTVEDFLLNEWQMGALLGDKPDKAFFVKCDRSTMTQNDLDNGRMVCLIGVAPVRPAEYVIFRIGQWTADRKV
jgi:phage tail sheath protein FI